MSAVAAIPASYTVQVNPGVISAGGTALDLLGMALSASTRVPIGNVYSFANLAGVIAFFGPGTPESLFAAIYFAANDNKTKTPDALLFTQYPTAAVAAYLRGGNISGLTLAQLQALAGVLTITIDGQSWTSSAISLSGAASFSDAAVTIQTALGANDAAFTGSIAPATSSFTGVLASGVLTASSVTGPIVPGATLAGSGVTGTPTIISQLTGTAGGAGTYQTSGTQTLGSVAMTTANAAAGVLTVASGLTGTLAIGQVVLGSTTAANTVITALLSGTGGLGTYVVSGSQTVGSASLTSGAAIVTYDSVSGAFIITGGTPGATGAITFATGSISSALLMTQATGAVISQGSAIATPNTFMTALVNVARNWFSFTTVGFKPSIANMVAFAAWTSAQNDAFAYAMWDTDITVTTNADTSSAGYQIIANGDSGTIPIYEPSNLLTAAMVMGAAASIDFTRRDGRRNFKFLTQSGLAVAVTSQTVAAQLTANGYNYYGANANATNEWNYFAEGSITGPFIWADSYANQAWLNAGMQTALMTLLTSANSVPFNPAGQTMIEESLSDPIQAAVNFGAITPNVPLSGTQIAEVNAAAGFPIDGALSSRGWYVLAPIPGPTVRAARGPWDVTLFYNDGGSVNRINLASVLVQ